MHLIESRHSPNNTGTPPFPSLVAAAPGSGFNQSRIERALGVADEARLLL
jgi:hypothetical protein